MNQQANPNDTYTSPLASRNASREMLRIWSPRHKFDTWRRIWLAIAQAQHEVTKDRVTKDRDRPLVTAEQVAELKAVVDRGITDDEIQRAAEIEGELRHDLMSHVHCLGERCPKAKGIIHLGCTSQDVVCNADLLNLTDALRLVMTKTVRCLDALGRFGAQHASVPALGLTHYQPAQPTTVGRRAAGWAFDLHQAYQRAEHLHGLVRFRGLRGATGTQASFVSLFQGDTSAIDRLESRFTSIGGESDRPGDFEPYALTGQTYPRVVDTFILADLASIASVLHKIATDIRLLVGRKELDEPFGDKQIGSSAMPYKRNPMRCERVCGLTRFVMNLVGNAYDTAATQWLERTLDDSSNRRLSLPEAFLALDGALDLMRNVAGGLVVHEATVRKNLMAELPFLATENILMEAVKAGGDRQDLHESLRVHAQEAGHRVKHLGEDNDLIERIRGDEAFASIRHLLTEDALLDPMNYVGRAAEQTERFVADVIGPLRERYADDIDSGDAGEPRV